MCSEKSRGHPLKILILPMAIDTVSPPVPDLVSVDSVLVMMVDSGPDVVSFKMVLDTGSLSLSVTVIQRVLVQQTRKSDRKSSARFFCLVLPVWYRTSSVLVLCLFAGQGYEKNNLLPVV